MPAFLGRCSLRVRSSLSARRYPFLDSRPRDLEIVHLARVLGHLAEGHSEEARVLSKGNFLWVGPAALDPVLSGDPRTARLAYVLCDRTDLVSPDTTPDRPPEPQLARSGLAFEAGSPSRNPSVSVGLRTVRTPVHGGIRLRIPGQFRELADRQFFCGWRASDFFLLALGLRWLSLRHIVA